MCSVRLFCLFRYTSPLPLLCVPITGDNNRGGGRSEEDVYCGAGAGGGGGAGGGSGAGGGAGGGGGCDGGGGGDGGGGCDGGDVWN